MEIIGYLEFPINLPEYSILIENTARFLYLMNKEDYKNIIINRPVPVLPLDGKYADKDKVPIFAAEMDISDYLWLTRYT